MTKQSGADAEALGAPAVPETVRAALLEAVNDEEVLDLASRLIAIESHSLASGQETPAATWLRDLMRAEGIAAELVAVEGERCNVIATLGEDTRPCLMLNGHVDTVPPGEMERPFDPVIRDGFLRGRGAADMKGAVAAQVCALLALKRAGTPLHGSVVFAGVVGEEQGTSQGSMHLVAHGPQPDYVVVGEPTGLRTAVAHRGFDYYHIEVEGRAAHSSRPENGVNAVYKAAAVVEGIRTRLIPRTQQRIHPLLGAAPINVSAILGCSRNEEDLLRSPGVGRKSPGAIVPDRCTVFLDRRRIPGESLEEILAGFENLVAELAAEDSELRARVQFVPASPQLETHPPLDTAPTHPLAHHCAAWSTLVTGVVDEPCGVPFWSDAALFNAFAGIPAIVYGPGFIDVAHSAEETVPVAHLGQAARVYALLAASLAGAAPIERH